MAITHYKDNRKTQGLNEYRGSPHIVNSLNDGTFTICSIVSTKITNKKDEVTCNRCLNLLEGKKAEYNRNPRQGD